MLMTRILYASFLLFLLVLNGSALWTLMNPAQRVAGIVPAALIVNSVAWPLALVIAYRTGQFTNEEHRRRMRAKMGAGRVLPADH
jgi:hypothetical protein